MFKRKYPNLLIDPMFFDALSGDFVRFGYERVAGMTTTVGRLAVITFNTGVSAGVRRDPELPPLHGMRSTPSWAQGVGVSILFHERQNHNLLTNILLKKGTFHEYDLEIEQDPDIPEFMQLNFEPLSLAPNDIRDTRNTVTEEVKKFFSS